MVNCTWTVDAPSACPMAGNDGRYMAVVSGPSAVRNDSNNVSEKVPGRSIIYSITRHVIASQRVRPEVAGPMTGSAKQSSPDAPSELLRCFAPRNDECII